MKKGVKQKGLWLRFVARWVVCTLGLWIASGLLGSDRLSVGGSWKTAVGAGFFLALVNMAVKPLLLFLSIPALILSLGLFLLVINGFLILLVSWIYHPLYVKDLGVAIIAGVVVGLVNLLVTRILEDI